MKFNLEQIIHYMMENRPCSAPVLSRSMIENTHDDWQCTDAENDAFTPFGPAGIKYNTCHGIIKEEDAFGSKKELLNSFLD